MEKGSAAGADVAGLVEQPVPDLDECFRLTQGLHVQTSEDIAQMLLRHGGAAGAGRSAQYAGGLAGPGALAIGARGMVDGVLEHAGDRAVVFGGDEQQAVGRRDAGLQPLDGFGGANFTMAPASLRLKESRRRLPTTTAIWYWFMKVSNLSATQSIHAARMSNCAVSLSTGKCARALSLLWRYP